MGHRIGIGFRGESRQMSMLMARPAIAAMLVAAMAGCAPGSGDGLDQNGNPIAGSAAPIPLAANFRSIQANIFDVSCALSGCHSGASPQAGLSLAAGASFANLVEQASSEVPNLNRVEPGDPDNSYLIRKVEGTASVGVRMPRNQAPLSAAKLQALREWVSQGALGPALSSIQRNVFTPICTQCHFGNTPAGSMNLEDGQAYASLVGTKRAFDPEIRVVAGDAASSFLIDKLEGNSLGGSRGDRMPLGGPFLDQSVIAEIRDWIDAGAEDN